MKAYVITTGAIFGLIIVAHVCRLVADGPQLATNPFFILMTTAAAGLCVWACCLLKAGIPRGKAKPPGEQNQ